MRKLMKLAVVTAAMTAAVTACDSNEKAKAPGASSKNVCGHFAKQSAVAAALARIGGTERFTDAGSKPKETLASLRSADGKIDSTQETQGSPLCALKSADTKDLILTIYFREALTVAKANSESEKTFTFYDTGASALGSDRLASIYFRCHMTNPSKDIIVNGTLERENKVDVPDKEVAGKQMVVMNAAARKVADELGCENPKLTAGAPKAVSGVYAEQ